MEVTIGAIEVSVFIYCKSTKLRKQKTLKRQMRIPLELIYAWCQSHEEHAGVELLMLNRGDDARGLVVAKHVHLWLRLECRAEIRSLGCGSILPPWSAKSGA